MLGKLLCFIGKHKTEDEWTLQWWNKSYYCHCERCGKKIWEWDV